MEKRGKGDRTEGRVEEEKKVNKSNNSKSQICSLVISSSVYLETAGELNHLLGLDVLQTINTSDAITDTQNPAGLLQLHLVAEPQDTLLQDRGDFCTSRTWQRSYITRSRDSNCALALCIQHMLEETNPAATVPVAFLTLPA